MMSLFSDATLVLDSDISAWESKMPNLAKTQNAYDGKRALSKQYIAKQLLKRGIDPASLTDPSQLRDAAVFMELSLMYQDMSSKENSIAGEKSLRYKNLFESELELIILTITSLLGNAVTASPTLSSIPLRRY